MENDSLEQKVRSINWGKYLAPEYYDPEKMDYDPNELVEALIELNQVDETNVTNGFLSKIRCAVGNDHRGTYYPVFLEAIDILIEIEKNSDNETARKCAEWILGDLHYFELEMPENEQNLYNSINNSIREKLKPYSEEMLEKN